MGKRTRSFVQAAILDWKIESNWTDPLLFACYSVVRPLAASLILVAIYGVAAGRGTEPQAFAWMYLGNAFYLYVAEVTVGISWSVTDDREHYRTLKYLYAAPIDMPCYLLGRGVAKFIEASISLVILLAFGFAALGLKLLPLGEIDWLLLAASFVLGLVALSGMGLVLAGLALRMAKHEGMIGEAVGGALFIFSGAVFPLAALPPGLREAGLVFPPVWWLEPLRRSLTGGAPQANFASWSNASLLLALALVAVLYFIAGLVAFRILDRSARERGLIDWTSDF